MPTLQAYYEKHKPEGLEILAISMDDARDLAEVRKIARQFSFPVAIKSQANFKGLGRIWRMPTKFVIDKDGI
jgi:peroxiredoxin